jgi:hypothetical protein
MGRVHRWHGFGAGRRRSYVGRHEARGWRAATRGIVAVVVAVLAVATVAFIGIGPSGSRVDPPRSRPPPPASYLIAAPGFGVGVEGWRALPGTFVTKGQLGAPTASYARVQRDPTAPARRDSSTHSAITGLATRVRMSATVDTPLRATVRVRASRAGVSVLVRRYERVGDKEVSGSERRVRLQGTDWQQVVAAHRVLRAGAAIYLEISALALQPQDALFVDQTKVTSP